MQRMTEPAAPRGAEIEAGAELPAGGYTDIVRDGWVARLPPGWIPYALLARLDRPIGAWLLFLPGLWSILLARVAFERTLWLIALFLAGAVLMRGAGCVVNDMWDRNMDRLVTRTAGRPLASGALTLRHAAMFLIGLLTVSLGILLMLDRTAQWLGVGSLLLVAVYPLAKRVTWWPQLMLGVTFGWGAPMGYAAATGRLNAAPAALYLAAIVWILGYDTVYAHQDREDDALVGVRSTARLFGERSRPFLAACYAATILLLAASGRLAGLSMWFDVALALPAGLLAWQVARLDVNDPALCLRLFQANREVGLLVGLAIASGRFF
jgi:4-hydroxybenzoate polyprenyltransferase